MSSRHPTGVILTGGASRRMGADKAFVVVDGRPMVVAVADALWEAGCHPVECQGGDLERLAALGLNGAPDAAPGGGPVAAIGEARQRHDGPVVVAACDLPRLDAPTVRLVIDAGRAHGSVAVASTDGDLHLVSYWPPEALEPETTDLAYREALRRVGAIEVPVDADTMRNVNGPDDI